MSKDMGFVQFFQKDNTNGFRQPKQKGKKEQVKNMNVIKPRHMNQSRTSN